LCEVDVILLSSPIITAANVSTTVATCYKNLNCLIRLAFFPPQILSGYFLKQKFREKWRQLANFSKIVWLEEYPKQPQLQP